MESATESGQSITDFCASTGVSRNTYFYWQRKLRDATCTELTICTTEAEQSIVPSGWARLEVSQPSATEMGITIEFGGCRVTATFSSDPVLLTQVCRMLKSL